MFALYLLRECLIPNTLLWYLCTSWFQETNIHLLLFLVSFSFLSFLILVNSMISSLNFSNRLSCVGLVVKYPIISFEGHHSIFNSLLLIHSVMKKKRMLMCLVRLLLDEFSFLSRRMALFLP